MVKFIKRFKRKLVRKIVHRLGGVTLNEIIELQKNIDEKKGKYSVDIDTELTIGKFRQR